jgi:hypothetical protein
MKLELKHLAPYLPYRLKILDEKSEPSDNIFTLESINIYESVSDTEGNIDIPFTEIKPILRPLSDLTKEIEFNGEKFVTIELLLDIECGNKFSNGFLESKSGTKEWWTSFKNTKKSFVFGYNESFGFYIINRFNEKQNVKNQIDLFQKLFELHFDVFGLIEQGLAISIHEVCQADA